MSLTQLAKKIYDFSPRTARQWLRLQSAHRRAKGMTDCLAPILDASYFAKQNPLIESMIDRVINGESIDAVASGYNAREFGERTIEYPYVTAWLLSHDKGLDLLDVGCVMNNNYVDTVLGEHCRSVWFCNPAIEPLAISKAPVFYHVSPMERAFPRGDQFPLVTCLSTIEHIGYDNSQYGVKEAAQYTEPNTEPFITAFRKLAELTAPGGHLLISFPFGLREVLVHPGTAKKASQVMNYESLQEALPALEAGGIRTEVEVFEATASGWKQVEPSSCNARYADGCPGAGAVVLIKGEKQA